MTTRVIIIIVVVLILLGTLYVINKLRELKKKNKFKLTGYDVSLGFFPSIDIHYEKID